MRHVVICAFALGMSCGASAAERGLASYYHNPHAHGLTAAHKSLPKGSHVRVRNLANGRTADVTIVDRGPYVGGRIIDVSPAAAETLGFRREGVAPVQVESPASTPGQTTAFAICKAGADQLERLPGGPEPGLGCQSLRSPLFVLDRDSAFPALAAASSGALWSEAKAEGPSARPRAAAPKQEASLSRRSGGVTLARSYRRAEPRPAWDPVRSLFGGLRHLF